MSTPIPSLQLTAAITEEDTWFVARCLEVEVTSQGRSIEEAIHQLREALELYFEDMPLPSPSSAPIVAHIVIASPHQ